MEERKLGYFFDEQAKRHPDGDCTFITYGKPVRRYQEPAQKSVRQQRKSYVPRRALNLKALRSTSLKRDRLDELLLDKATPSDGFSREGDIILALAYPFACAYMRAEDIGLFIPNTCAAIRMDTETRAVLDPWYLAGFLALPTTREILSSKTAGGKSQLLTIDQVKDLAVPLPPFERQQLLGKAACARADTLVANRDIEYSELCLLEAAYARTVGR